MAHLMDRLAGRRRIECTEDQGLELAIRTVKEFGERTFKCPDTRPKTSNIRSQEMLEFLEKELPTYYSYTTRVKKYLDRKGIAQVRIEIAGTMELSSQMKRYNPLDISLSVRSESPGPSRNHRLLRWRNWMCSNVV